jgi:hypothetical protein
MHWMGLDGHFGTANGERVAAIYGRDPVSTGLQLVHYCVRVSPTRLQHSDSMSAGGTQDGEKQRDV